MSDQINQNQKDFCQEEVKNRPPYFYNAHAHVFTLDHVPDKFAKGLLPATIRISWLRNNLVLWITEKGHGFLRKMNKLFKISSQLEHKGEALDRIFNLVRHGNKKTQKEIVDNLKDYYPWKTKFILLSMDMEYMHGGLPKERYFDSNPNVPSQIRKLAALKKDKAYSDTIYPFIFAEPNRMNESKDYSAYFKEELKAKTFAGIKLYPALGYWPFDKRLKETYDFALAHNIPLMSHCVRGVVYDRDPEKLSHHPIASDIELKGKSAGKYSTHFTNPLNFHFLMQQELLREYWGEKAPDYSKLKVCLAHFGGSSEWNFYLDNAWHPDSSEDDLNVDFPALQQGNWNFDLTPNENSFGWFSIICEMIRKYDNVYADISFTLYDEKIWPLLKMLLQTSTKLKTRILFGTDFYVVAQKGTERRLSIDLRSYLGEDLFYQIAYCNVEEYLSTNFNDE